MLSRMLMGVGFVFLVGVAHADEYSGTLVKVADGKVTFTRGTGKKKKEFSVPIAEKCRVFVAKYNSKTKTFEAGAEFEGGVSNPIFKHLEKESFESWIVTDAKNETIHELRLFQLTTKKKKSK